MDITTFLAMVWGPAVLAVGAGIFLSSKYYGKIYRNLESEPLAVLIFGMLAIALGVAQVSVHNVWDTMPQIVVSLFGWGLLAKGVLFAVYPGFVDKMGDWAASSKLIPVAGGLTLIAGAYLCWVGFLA